MKREGAGATMAERGTAATAATVETGIAASYNALLEENPDLCRETQRALIEEHHNRDLLFQGRLLSNVLRPRFITHSQMRKLEHVSTTLAAVFERAGEALLADERSLEALGATDHERELWAVDPGYPGFTLSSRLDAFMHGDKVRFVEYNAESPAGIAFSDTLTDVFLGLPAMKAWEKRSDLGRFHGCRHLLDTLLWAYEFWGGRRVPTIAIIDWDHVITRRDFELCADFFRESGIPTVIADPRKLDNRGGRIMCGNEQIDIVYRRVLLHELLTHREEVDPLLQGYRDGAVCMVNSPRSKLLHKKGVLALLSEGSIDVGMTSDEQGVVDDVVPWTRLMREGATTLDGEEIDLVGHVLSHKDSLVLKPIDDYGGRGIVLGWEIDQMAWERAVETATQSGYVVQDRVHVPGADFPVWSGTGLAFSQLLFDTNPLLFRSVLGSVLTRLSPSALLNVSAGDGSTAPTFIASEEN